MVQRPIGLSWRASFVRVRVVFDENDIENIEESGNVGTGAIYTLQVAGRAIGPGK